MGATARPHAVNLFLLEGVMASPLENNKTAAVAGDPKHDEPMDGVDEVEIKVTIRPDHELKATRAMQLHEHGAEVRVIYFYDTPNLELFDAGIVLRARQLSGDDDDSTVKFRRAAIGSIDASWKLFEGFKLEADCVGDEVIHSASLTVLQRRDEIDDVAEHKRPIEKLFSREQERFLGQFYPGRVDFGGLQVLGPIRVLRWQLQHSDFPHELTVEEWRLPDGDDLVEVSIKAAAEQAADARREFEEHLNALGLDPQGNQETKTRTALKFFTR
jgi:adenylate cyclase class IV